MAIYYIMFFFVAVVILSGLSVTVLFNLQDIVTEGDSRYTSEQIIAASGIKTGVNLIRFNTDDSRQRIIDSLVYVDEVVIRKNPLANRITIEVTGAEEMAAVAYDNAFLVISKNGRILESTRRHTGLPIIHGFEAYEPVVGGRISSEETRKTELAFIIMQTIEKVGLEEILSINIEDFLDITLNYMNRVTVEIGPETQLEEKLRVAVRLLNYEIDINERGTLILLNPLQAVFSPE
ncbi:MAG: FtsQ-type POTRA domain-containing protein [Oscillospiraceae bacterium]|nr:FtsQ-type POTRA domain-containing protein [Oscillospiraceae bacterium]